MTARHVDHTKETEPVTEVAATATTTITVAIGTSGAAETRAFAAEVGGVAGPGWVILLEGPLGAGKTVFAQGVLQGIGYRGRVASPTFTLINEYRAKFPVWHADVYRLSGHDDFAAAGGDELLQGHSGVAMIEWAEKLGAALPRHALRVRLDFACADLPDDRRRITVSVTGNLYRDVLPVLRRWSEKSNGGFHLA